MSRILLASTVLTAAAGMAAADVTLSGDARMGLVNGYDLSTGKYETTFSSRARVTFTMSAESDNGLSFGASFRADNANAAEKGTAGSVFISGAFGKLSMGDNDSAAQATVGQVDGVGFTGNGDWHEIIYMGDSSPSVLYTYSAGDLTFAASVGQRGVSFPRTLEDGSYANETENGASVAVGYRMGNTAFRWVTSVAPRSSIRSEIVTIPTTSSRPTATPPRRVQAAHTGMKSTSSRISWPVWTPQLTRRPSRHATA